MYNDVAVDEYNKNVFSKQRVKKDKKKASVVSSRLLILLQRKV